MAHVNPQADNGDSVVRGLIDLAHRAGLDRLVIDLRGSRRWYAARWNEDDAERLWHLADTDYGPGGLQAVKGEVAARVMVDPAIQLVVGANTQDAAASTIVAAVEAALADLVDEGGPYGEQTARTAAALLTPSDDQARELRYLVSSIYRGVTSGEAAKIGEAPWSPYWRVMRMYLGQNADYDAPEVVAWVHKYARSMEDAQRLLSIRDDQGEVSMALGRRTGLDELARRGGFKAIPKAQRVKPPKAPRKPDSPAMALRKHDAGILPLAALEIAAEDWPTEYGLTGTVPQVLAHLEGRGFELDDREAAEMALGAGNRVRVYHPDGRALAVRSGSKRGRFEFAPAPPRPVAPVSPGDRFEDQYGVWRVTDEPTGVDGMVHVFLEERGRGHSKVASVAELRRHFTERDRLTPAATLSRFAPEVFNQQSGSWGALPPIEIAAPAGVPEAVEAILESPGHELVSALRLRGPDGAVAYSWAYGSAVRAGDLEGEPEAAPAAAGFPFLDTEIVQWGDQAQTDDYPLGRRRRGTAAWAVQTSPRHGARVARRTRPEGRSRWSQPNATTYGRRARIGMGENGRVYFVIDTGYGLDLYRGTMQIGQRIREGEEGYAALVEAAFAAVPLPEPAAAPRRATKWDTMKDAVWAAFPSAKRSGTKAAGDRTVGGVPLDTADNAAVGALYTEHVVSQTRPTADELAQQLRDELGDLFEGYRWSVVTDRHKDDVRFHFSDVPADAGQLQASNTPYRLVIVINAGKGFRWLPPKDGVAQMAPPKLKTETRAGGGGYGSPRAKLKPRGTSGKPEQVLARVVKWLKANAAKMKLHPVGFVLDDVSGPALAALFRDGTMPSPELFDAFKRVGFWYSHAQHNHLTHEGERALKAWEAGEPPPRRNPLVNRGPVGERSLADLARVTGREDLADWLRSEWPMLRQQLRSPGVELGELLTATGDDCEPPTPACVAVRRARGSSS